MDKMRDLQRSVAELKRLTGLKLNIDCQADEDSAFALEQINQLITAYKEKNDKNTVFKKWILGDMDDNELYYTSKRFHVPFSASRSLFLVESREPMDDSALTILKHIFPNTSSTWIVPLTPRQLVLVSTFTRKTAEEKLLSTAYTIMDVLNTEALLQVKVAFSSMTEHLGHLPSAYQEACLALNIGKTFYTDQNVYPYNQLGIGRLIYGLSKEQCSSYLQETFGTDSPAFFRSESIHVINCFLNNNLNIAETARQLHMHRNTFIYRLEQIEKETGLDIRQFHDAMTIKTAMLVMNYLESLS